MQTQKEEINREYWQEILQIANNLKKEHKDLSKGELVCMAIKQHFLEKKKRKKEEVEKQFQAEIQREIDNLPHLYNKLPVEEKAKEAVKRWAEKRKPFLEKKWNAEYWGAFRFKAKDEEMIGAGSRNYMKQFGIIWAEFKNSVCTTTNYQLCEDLEQAGYEQLLPSRLEELVGQQLRQEEEEKKKREEEERKRKKKKRRSKKRSKQPIRESSRN